MQVTGMSGFGPVLSDTTEQEKLCTDDLGIAFEEVYDDYRFTEHLKGARHFSLMPLSRLPTSLFDGSAWPADVTVRQAWVEFQVDDIDAATQELQDRATRCSSTSPRQHLEQAFHVNHRLLAHRVGQRMDFGKAQPDALAEAIAGQIGRTAGPVTLFGLGHGLRALEWLIWAPYMTLTPDGPRAPIPRYTGDALGSPP
jgi:hypothetical protein